VDEKGKSRRQGMKETSSRDLGQRRACLIIVNVRNCHADLTAPRDSVHNSVLLLDSASRRRWVALELLVTVCHRARGTVRFEKNESVTGFQSPMPRLLNLATELDLLDPNIDAWSCHVESPVLTARLEPKKCLQLPLMRQGCETSVSDRQPRASCHIKRA
jgi:hypothetical protein